MDYRSQLAGGDHRGDLLVDTAYPEAVNAFPVKFWWFNQHGYKPHVWQALFHGAAMSYGDVKQFRHLVAGRRGGKTLSAAWEVLFYALHPSEFHRDAHQVSSEKALWIWILTKDFPTGFPALTTLLDVMAQAGLVKGKDYSYNKVERRIEFTESGTVIQLKTADDPQSLRGAGLDILWIDEAAFIKDDEAWLVVAPALADKEGLVITTTTPHGKNWFWREFFDGKAMDDPHQFRVEYTSIDSPYFSRRSWQYYRERYHPIMFKQEFMAAFDAFTGIALHGDWLKYYVTGGADAKTDDVSLKRYKDDETGAYKLRIFIGVDPAISLSESADHFAMVAVGVPEDNSMVFLLDVFVGRLEFPDQIDKLREWFLKWRPERMGIEAVAYQQALYQMAQRMDGMPAVVPVFSKGKKNDRILAMAPLFKIGKVRIAKTQGEFIEQWVNFNPKISNQEDDILDATEIALSAAGVLLPMMPHAAIIEGRPRTIHQEATAQIRAGRRGNYDPELGSES